jgi:hypothetical protein
MPSSVSTLISVVDRVFRTPERLNTCPSLGIGARRRMVFDIGDIHLSPEILVILIIVTVIIVRADRIDDQQTVIC